MAEALETDALFARAAAAIAEAKLLTAQSHEWQATTFARLRYLSFQFTFEPKSLKLYSPLDFPGRRRPYEPFPTEADPPRTAPS